MLVFYLNYGWLVRRYLFNRRTGRFLLINLLLIGGMMLFVHLCMRYFYPPEMHHPARPPRPLNETVGFFLVNAVIYSLVAGLSAVSYTHLDVYKRQLYEMAQYFQIINDDNPSYQKALQIINNKETYNRLLGR